MNSNISARYQKAFIICGLLFGTLFFVALLLNGQIPPPSPLVSGEEMANFIESRMFLSKLSLPVGVVAAGLCIPWCALISAHIARIELSQGNMPLLSIASFGAGMINGMLFLLPFLLWPGMFFRPDRDPATMQFFSDLTWLNIVAPFAPAVIQNICIALAGFMDKSNDPVFPRWVCFAMLWVAVLTVPGFLGYFFYKGPFAWNGLIVFWLPATAFGLYLGSLAYVMWGYAKRNANRQNWLAGA